MGTTIFITHRKALHPCRVPDRKVILNLVDEVSCKEYPLSKDFTEAVKLDDLVTPLKNGSRFSLPVRIDWIPVADPAFIGAFAGMTEYGNFRLSNNLRYFWYKAPVLWVHQD
jgi:hypothetical protein